MVNLKKPVNLKKRIRRLPVSKVCLSKHKVNLRKEGV